MTGRFRITSGTGLLPGSLRPWVDEPRPDLPPECLLGGWTASRFVELATLPFGPGLRRIRADSRNRLQCLAAGSRTPALLHAAPGLPSQPARLLPPPHGCRCERSTPTPTQAHRPLRCKEGDRPTDRAADRSACRPLARPPRPEGAHDREPDRGAARSDGTGSDRIGTFWGLSLNRLRRTIVPQPCQAAGDEVSYPVNARRLDD